jgi:hypothetical protein
MNDQNDIVHANTKVRTEPPTLVCGAPRAEALVTGDPAQVTCAKCKGK